MATEKEDIKVKNENEENELVPEYRIYTKNELSKSENIVKIMSNSMSYVIQCCKYKPIEEIKNDLEIMKKTINNDVIKILNNNSQEFMLLPSHLHNIESIIPVLKKEINISNMYVKKLLNEINKINKNRNNIFMNKINIFYIRHILKYNIEIEQLLNKLQACIYTFEKLDLYTQLLNLKRGIEQSKDEINNNLLKNEKNNHSYMIYYLSEKIINLAKGIWKIKAMLYNNYKRIIKIANTLDDMNILIQKYGTLSNCPDKIVNITQNYSFQYLNNYLINANNQIVKLLEQLSFVFFKIAKNGIIQNFQEDFFFNQSINHILSSYYLLNSFDIFIRQFQDIFFVRPDFSTYDEFLAYVKSNIIDNKFVNEIGNRIDEIDQSINFFRKGIVEKILDIIKIHFNDIFLLRYCDLFIENYIKTLNFLNNIKNERNKYEQFMLEKVINDFLTNFERETYEKYILNILENKINGSFKNIILFDKKYKFDNKFYWLKETINLIKIFKILFTDKYYISFSLKSYLHFILNHFKSYINNVKTFISFLNNSNCKIGSNTTEILLGSDKFNRPNWSPTLTYNSIGFFLSDFLSLRNMLKTDCEISSFIDESNKFYVPSNIGDISIWIFTKILSDYSNAYYEDDNFEDLSPPLDNKNENIKNVDSLNKVENGNKENKLNKGHKLISSFDENKLKDKQLSIIMNECNDSSSESDGGIDCSELDKEHLNNIDILHKLGYDNKNILKKRKKKIKQDLYIYKKNNSKKISNDINCINGFLLTLSKIIENTQEYFQEFFINKMFEICSSFLVYLHSLLPIYKMTNKRAPEKASDNIDKIVLPLVSFKSFYNDTIENVIIEDIISKIVDKINIDYLEKIKTIIDVKICEENKKILKLNLYDAINSGDIPYEEKIQRQLFLDVRHYEEICNNNFKINKNTSESMNKLVNYFETLNKEIKMSLTQENKK
ncbi:conserved oligomeric Golgi complex subunit 2, putative [Plasmodium chabaudi chabaudi]|uniref:Conserved oligomeric Golgi complex subunit 2 n=1 Tax=Plasmodium chabaudi chabaudi TaxID=31271 RepID=A0A4V0K9H2_PLACU|nr:conserved oligomeric Golgi complex subunit 2, putative [Plasmodium chabaudi chabaudi]VTZ68892.1 conserved oligomeric Golgi complex subunit 2, putative [Plasmodium chabaudi chabaudi]|eukprot:XP_016655417.1 conserved Plasmodium protein, unknown function [Plasmodium chabaudi chabaudi]